MEYGLLSRDELIQLQQLSIDAIHIKNQTDFKHYLASFASLFPNEQLAIVAYCQEGQVFRLKALHNQGFPAEREADFKQAKAMKNCQVLIQQHPLFVNTWHQQDVQKKIQAGADAIRYGITEGLYGVIKPTQSMVGVLCSMAGDDLADNPRHRQMLTACLPHLQLAQSSVLNISQPVYPKGDIQLTQREYEVLEWLCGGKTNWEVSKILNISEHTVKFHVTNLSQKLGANNRAHIVALGGELLGLR
ncbi:helix-turn-helix transcriptional regulator [Photobacterium sp. 1_MG-2023]|uniref:helix-turn-helix domain-containing protein n=1 Tax=Photobacterium sp. 1_MG-2023 TaxID=3062646 RepID=UPI0026E2F7CF|nr:helix-turn-helix transcriptional regulator [Photobacterium sp. 1_MG-2023]MDO6707322.1 helix-turn-helix transcriptional regulator [Photobacterium sp. 1_MG-2023]